MIRKTYDDDDDYNNNSNNNNNYYYYYNINNNNNKGRWRLSTTSGNDWECERTYGKAKKWAK